MSPASPPLTEWTVVVGYVASVHGLQGEVRVHPISEDPERFAVGGAVCAVCGDGRREQLSIAACRPHRRGLLVSFTTITTRDEAERLRGATLTIAPSMRRDLPPGRYYHDQLLGLSVVTDAGRDLGTVTDLLETPANDVLVTERALIPAVRQFVREVDLDGRRIVVADVPGLATDDDAG